jgi:IS30 family transposase
MLQRKRNKKLYSSIKARIANFWLGLHSLRMGQLTTGVLLLNLTTSSSSFYNWLKNDRPGLSYQYMHFTSKRKKEKRKKEKGEYNASFWPSIYGQTFETRAKFVPKIKGSIFRNFEHDQLNFSIYVTLIITRIYDCTVERH